MYLSHMLGPHLSGRWERWFRWKMFEEVLEPAGRTQRLYSLCLCSHPAVYQAKLLISGLIIYPPLYTPSPVWKKKKPPSSRFSQPRSLWNDTILFRDVYREDFIDSTQTDWLSSLLIVILCLFFFSYFFAEQKLKITKEINEHHSGKEPV